MRNSEIRKINGQWDTHNYYQTINHFHLSCLPDDGDFADIMAVECKDGRWFLEEQSGESGDEKLFDSYSDEFKEPHFFDTSEAAKEYAIKVINRVTGVSIEELIELYRHED